MLLRILLYLLYLLIPIIIIFVTFFTINISSNKQTEIHYTISSSDLINPSYIYYSKPEDIMLKNPFYLSEEIIQIMTRNLYLFSNNVDIIFDIEGLCKLDFEIQEKEIKTLSFNELLISIKLINANEEMLEKTDDCMNIFIENLNYLLFFKYTKEKTLDRINYNINVLDLIINSSVSKYYIDTEKYYSETRAQIIINTLNIIEKALYDAIENFENLKQKSNNEEELILVDNLLEILNKQEDILSSFNIGQLGFNEDVFSFTPKDTNSEKEFYYNYLLDKFKNIKSNILNNQVSLKINDIKVDRDIDNEKTIITPGYILFILLLSSLIIIMIEFLYRKFRY